MAHRQVLLTTLVVLELFKGLDGNSYRGLGRYHGNRRSRGRMEVPWEPIREEHRSHDAMGVPWEPIKVDPRSHSPPTVHDVVPFTAVSYKDSKIFHTDDWREYPSYPLFERTMLSIDREEEERTHGRDSVGTLIDRIADTDRKTLSILNGNNMLF